MRNSTLHRASAYHGCMKSVFQSTIYVLLPSVALWWFLNSSWPQQTNRLNSEEVRKLQHYDQSVQSEIDAIWKRIEIQLRDHEWEQHVRLNPPATLQEIKELEGALGYRLAGDYKASLLVHNGSEGDFCSYDQLYSTTRVLKPWKIYVEVHGSFAQNEIHPNPRQTKNFWHPGWTPVAGWNAYETVINAETGQVLHWDEYTATYQAASWKAWLENVASRLESGEFRLEQRMVGQYFWTDDDYRTPGSEKKKKKW